jgi:hypothetical protein
MFPATGSGPVASSAVTVHELGDPQDKTTRNPHGPLTIPCENCHTAAGWRPIRAVPEFDHNKTNYPLRGMHEKVPCVQCHVKPVFTNVGKQCADCHKVNDVHRGQNGSNCEQCHTVQGWDVAVQQVKDHMNRFPLLGAHAAVQCEDCHKQAATGIFFGLSTDCQSCHLKDWQSTTNPPHAQDPTDFPPSGCQTCHKTFDSWLGASFTGNHAAPPINFPLTLGHANVPCQQCHVSNNYHLQIAATDCGNAGCHLTTWQQTNNPPHPSAGPIFAAANCSNCHTPASWNTAVFDHSTTGFPLTNGHANLQCTQCHVNNNYTLQTAPNDCGNSGCHLSTWQQTNNPVHSTSGTAFAASNCSQCHDTIAWTDMTSFNHSVTGFTLTGGHVTTPCIQCHVNNNYTLQIQQNDCGNSGCHLTQWNSTQTMGGGVPNHITAGFPIAQCSTCHNTTSWSNATFDHSTTGFPLTNSHQMAPAGKVTQCAQCHLNNNYNLQIQPTDCGNAGCHLNTWQTTNNPVHATAGPTFAVGNCSGCHDTIAWTDQLGFNHSVTGFALTGTHATTPCAQCHVNNNYSLTSADCMGCHQSSWSSTQTLGGNVPNHVAANFPTTASACSTCHPITTWADGKFDHSSTGFPLTNSHQMAPAGKVSACSQCHVGGNYSLSIQPTDCGNAGCHLTTWQQTNNPTHSTAGTAFVAANCSTCHDTITWTDNTFDHSVTGFPLTGSHQLAPAGKVANCTQCHVGNNYNLTSAACYPCHTTDWTNTQTLGGNVPNHITAGFPQTCDTCHDTILWTDSTFNHNNTGFPLAGLHTSVQCAQCHSVAAGGYSLGAPTGCAGTYCHATDYSSTNNPVHSSAGTMFAASNCTNCHSTNAAFTTTSWSHTSTGWALTGNHQMAPAGATTNCNQCHVANNYNITSTACYPCHTTDWNNTQTLGGAVPNHITSGFPQTCDTCHDTILWTDSTFNHNNTGFPLTGLHATAVQCAQCHTTAAGGYNLPAPSGCGDANCHAADYSGTNNPVHSAAGTTFGPANCANCHSTAAAFTTTSWSHNSTPWPLTGNHQMAPAGAATNCNQCHVGNNYGLSTGDCWNSNCHTTDWNSTATLGGAVPNHVAANFPTSMCATCHDTMAWADGKFDHSTTGWALTGGHVVPTAGGAQACTDCHVSNNYSLTSANTACYGCHLAQWNSTQTLGGSVPNHISAGYPTTCDSCHTTTNWLGATFNHTYFPIPHHGSACADCHQVSTDYSQFTCINCHTTTAHQQTQTNNQHGGVNGYTYGPTTCYNCHKNGGG